MKHKHLFPTSSGIFSGQFDLSFKMLLFLSIACFGIVGSLNAQPANDDCANAEVLGVPFGGVVSASGETLTATTSPGVPACGDGIGITTIPGVWYQFTGLQGRRYEISTCSNSTDYDTEMILMTGTCGNLFCVDGNDADFNCSFSLGHSVLFVNPTATTQYLVFVTGQGGAQTMFGGKQGNFELTITDLGLAGDFCDGASRIIIPNGGMGTIDGSTTMANANDAPQNCGSDIDNSSSAGLWYFFTGTGGRFYEITTCDATTNFDTEMSVYSGSCGNVTCIDSNDDMGSNCSQGAGGTSSRIGMYSPSTKPYRVYVKGNGAATGDFTLKVSDLGSTTPNDLCNNLEDMVVPDNGTVSRNGFTRKATKRDFPSNCGAGVNNSDAGGVWYFFTGTGSSLYEITTCNAFTNFDTEISVYTGSCGALSCVDGNDNDNVCSAGSGGIASTVLVSPGQGSEGYFVYVKGNGTSNGSNYGNFTLSITDLGDCSGPIASCRDATVQLDASGTATVDPASVDNGSTVPCGLQSLTVSPNTFDCTTTTSVLTPISEVVTLTVTDQTGNTATCTANVTAEDNIPPTVSCKDATLSLTDFGTRFVSGSDIYVNNSFSDNCPGFGFSRFAVPNTFNCSDVGENTVTLVVQVSPTNETGTCTATVTIVDDIMPYSICRDITVQLDENGERTVDESEIDGDFFPGLITSFDNCNFGLELELSPNFFDCNDLGDNPVTLTATDVGGNTSVCNAFITVEGLPCGFGSDPDGINCTAGNSVSYDPDTDAFTITSEGCYDPAFYSPNDSHGFISTELCGDGEIIAEVTEVNGNGWAGITMRETMLSGSKMLQLMIDGSYLTMRELRQSTNGIAYAHQFQTLGKNWLRLTRNGNTFGAYHSSDGVNWQAVLITGIPMTSCIEIGLVTANKTSSGTVTATFENMTVTGSGPAPLLEENGPNVESQILLGHNFELYPNPTSGETFVNLQEYVGERVTIHIFNSTGQLLERLEMDEIQVPTQRLDLNAYQDGLYLINVKVEGYSEVTKKLMLNRY